MENKSKNKRQVVSQSPATSNLRSPAPKADAGLQHDVKEHRDLPGYHSPTCTHVFLPSLQGLFSNLVLSIASWRSGLPAPSETFLEPQAPMGVPSRASEGDKDLK